MFAGYIGELTNYSGPGPPPRPMHTGGGGLTGWLTTEQDRSPDAPMLIPTRLFVSSSRLLIAVNQRNLAALNLSKMSTEGRRNPSRLVTKFLRRHARDYAITATLGAAGFICDTSGRRALRQPRF